MHSISRRALMRSAAIAPVATWFWLNARTASALVHRPLFVTAPVTPSPDETCAPPAAIMAPPTQFLETGVIHAWPAGAGALVGGEGRLTAPLRRAAQTHDPVEILKRAAIALYIATPPGVAADVRTRLIATNGFISATMSPAIDEAFAMALADLAVTGSASYQALRTAAPTLQRTIIDGPTGVAARLGVPASACEAIVTRVLQRASLVALALRAPFPQNTTTRRSIGGWIAVSGEDDPPHRPVNVTPVPYPQYDIPVTTHGVTIDTRFFIAAATPAPWRPTSPVGSRVPGPGRPFPNPLPGGEPRFVFTLPADAAPVVPDGCRVILFIHGHSSSAEEAVDIVPHLIEAGRARGVNYAIVSLDLPNCGYSSRFDHLHVPGLESSATTFPGGVFDSGPINTPALDFLEDFIVAFVDALDAITPMKGRFAGVIGGSLGGNMSLRLGRRDGATYPWLANGVVAWSPASVWDPFVRDETKRHAPEHAQEKWNEVELVVSRNNYFLEVFGPGVYRGDGSWDGTGSLIGGLSQSFHTQPDYWYRDGWPCKAAYIAESRQSRHEIYHEQFRRWHWRIAGEQLIYSHKAHVRYEDGSTPIRYTLNRLPLLLCAGAGDNYAWSNIYDATRDMATHMAFTPGSTLFLQNTGHSIHCERPRYFAEHIADFLQAVVTPDPPRRRLTRRTDAEDCARGVTSAKSGWRRRNPPNGWLRAKERSDATPPS